MFFEHSNGKLIFFIMTCASVSFDGALKLQGLALQSNDPVPILSYFTVLLDIFGLKVLVQLLVPVNIHAYFLKINQFCNHQPQKGIYTSYFNFVDLAIFTFRLFGYWKLIEVFTLTAEVYEICKRLLEKYCSN